MAIKEFYIGTCGPYLIDEGHPLYDDPGQMARQEQLVDTTTIESRLTTLEGYFASTFTGTIYTAKLTSGGTDGSMTFTNGVITAHTDAT
jgi:hypothetical protein